VRIACVHQGYELYGSDRCFVDSVAAIRKAFPAAEIEVVLPRSGPIVRCLEGIADRIRFEKLWVLRRRSLLRLVALSAFELPLAVARAARRFSQFDLVYVNTSVIVDHQLAARFFPGKAILHIHEIPGRASKPILRALARWSGSEIIFNSRATARAFAPLRDSSARVIYNGFAGPERPEPTTYDGTRPLRLLMLGRVSRIKGQDVLLEAFAALPETARSRLNLRIVGGAFESRNLEMALADKIVALNLGASVAFEPFVEDPSSLYRWADVVVVPSRLPESLGRVAIEALAYGRPALVSAIGGLTEVVVDGKCGWLVPPDEAEPLAQTLRAIIERPDVWRDFGAAARTRFEALFSDAAASAAIGSVLSGVITRRSSGAKGASGSLRPAARR
jgi:glycosyltransferase involved in cell wall biosynthesis